MTQLGAVPLAMAFVAGVFAFAGFTHVLVAIQRRDPPMHLVFGAMSLLAGAYAALGVVRHTTADPELWLDVVRWRVSLAQGVALSLAWFFALYADEVRRGYLWPASAVHAALVLANAASPHTILYGAPPAVRSVPLPWGETVTVGSAPAAWGWYAAPLMGLATLLFAGWCTWSLWRRDRRGEAMAAAAALAILLLVLLHQAFPVLGAFPTDEIAFLSVVVVMAFYMTGEVVQAGRVRDALDESERLTRAVVETAPEAILLLEGETGEALVANEQARRLFGLDDGSLRSFRPAGAAPDQQVDGAPSVLAFRREVMVALSGRRASFPWLALDADGAPVPCEALLVRLPGAGPARLRLSLVDRRDLHEAHERGERLEEQLRQSQKLESVGRLTGGVAHDFNNMLTVIRGSLELLREEGEDPTERRELLDETLQAVERASDLTGRLLAFGRRQPLAPRPVDVGEALESVRRLLSRTIREQIHIDCDVPDEVWPIHVDPAQLESAVVNLAINSSDAMPRGGRLRLGARNVLIEAQDYQLRDLLSPGEYVRIFVEDTGHGMDPAVLSRAIEPFFTTKSVGKGTGLGLSMAYGFATQSGGTLQLDSAVNRGTRAYLYFPRQGVPSDDRLRRAPTTA